MKAHLPLEIDFFIGAKGIDTWNREKWNDQFEKNNVLLMTPMILQNLLEYQIIDKERIALIIFDEAHWAACTIKDNNTVVPSNYSYNVILKCIQPSQMPNIRLVGLTASLINSIIPFHQIPIYIRYLEQAFNGTCIGAMGNPVYSNEMTIHCWTYRGKPLSLNLLKLMIGQVLSLIEAFATKTKGNRKWTIDCLKQSDSEDGDNQDLPAEENRILIKVAYFFVWTQIVLERLGVAITQDLILWCRDDLQNQLTAAVDSNPELACFLRQVLHVFKYIFCTFERTISHVADPKTRLYSLMTPKVLRLLDIIRHYRTKTGDKFRCLIFVSRRIFAILLSRMLNNLSGIDAEFSFLKSGVIFSRNAQDALLTQTCKQQNEYLLKFRKNELNCLVTTSVLEEGIDVPQCNLVIRFDDIHTFREWVQSKGRARLSNSIFILLHSEERRRQLLETTKEFTKLEQFLSQLDDGNRVSEDVTVVDKNLEDKVVSKTGRICSASQAYNQLRKYCSQTLDAANFPQWSVHRYDQHYQVEVQLPIKSQIKGRIVGKQCTSINSARDSAMLEAIRQLYEIGELCDNFFPKQKDEILNDLLKKRIKPLYNVKEYSELFLKPAAMRENLRKKEEAENTANTTNQNGSKVRYF